MTTPPRIQILPPLLVNKIAAGEVVERPASVVKELLDNAIDAGANRIALTVEDGGKKLIRVTDDGCGLSAEELRLAVTPHATSKIFAEEDLYSIASMGFRGEALASISSVSKLRMVSRRPGEEEGHEIRVAGDEVESLQAAGCATGTTVDIRDLFFNVPARRKFLRARSTEIGHINEQLTRAALAWPQISFELTNNGRVSHKLPACESRIDRIAKFYGPELASALLEVRREERGLTIEAYVAPPSNSRATASWQYTFVNSRYVRDRFLQHAIKEAHRGLLEHNRHGIVFMFLTIDPKEVDVNVHPTKIEVRWSDSGLIHSQALSALRETFQKAELSPEFHSRRSERTVTPAQQQAMRAELAAVLKSAQPQTGSSTEYSPFNDGKPPTGRADRMPTGDHSAPAVPDSWRALYAPADHRDASDSVDQPPPLTDRPIDELSRGRVVQMHNLYLVAETDDGIVIVDQHALHERVMYEQFKQRMTEGPLESQRLLLPETVTVSAAQLAVLQENEPLLRQLGIEVTPFGNDAAADQSFPVLLKNVEVVSFMRDLLDQLCEQPAADTEGLIHSVLDMMACKAAVKAGDTLTQQEIEALMSQRELIDKPSNCPHGRPTMLRLTKQELNRQFKRT